MNVPSPLAAPRPVARLASAIVALVLAALAVLAPVEARADACDFSEIPLNCSIRNYSGSVSGSFFGGVSSWFTTDEYPDCGTNTDYGENQDVFIYTCIRSTRVSISVQPTDCDVDVFLLQDSCNPTQPGSCEDASFQGGNAIERIDFDCEEGSVYYLSIERPDDDVLGDLCSLLEGITFGLFDICPCTANEDFGYVLRNICYENCNNRWDDDGDGLEDCLDPDCPVCQEICDDQRDNDYDNLVDCLDPDCASWDGCCDKDGDDYLAIGGICGGNDCNDSATAGGFNINPGAREIPADGVDSNCDGQEECFTDQDGDRFGIQVLQLSRTLSCLAPGLTTRANPEDCNDLDPAVYPGAPEIPVSDRDENCDRLELCFLDQDGDTYGRNFLTQSANLTCTGAGVSRNDDDCNDDNPLVNPSRPEIPLSGFDEDCNGVEICYADRDGDGFGDPNRTIDTPEVDCIGPGVSNDPRDCNDTPGAGASIFPGAPETVADGVDSDCDGLETCYLDEDRDTFGNNQGRTGKTAVLTCVQGGFSPNRTDCDDNDGTTFPGAPDPAGDGKDQNCDGLQDCYVDQDGDGFGSSTFVSSSAPGCIGVGISPVSGDCNDTNIAVNPAATETPANNTDQDCDGYETCYEDRDDDGFGRDALVESLDLTCNAAPNVSPNNRDCYDDPPVGATIYPGAPEVPLNGFDENCDGFERCFRDADSDGYGTTAGTLTDSTNFFCIGAGVSANDDDCNDADFRVNPGATETVANNRDETCDGFEACWRDSDGDSYGNSNGFVDLSPALNCRAPNVSPTSNDCDDFNNLVYPGATPPPGAPSGVDYSCTGLTLCYADQDNDNFGGGTQIQWSDPLCTGSFVSPVGGDCNDNNASIFPGATEVAVDLVDQDCDGFELCYQDLDGDLRGSVVTQLSRDVTCNSLGVSRTNDDCNDNPATNGANIYPGAPELPASGWDENCDGREDCYVDQDQDDYGRNSLTSVTDITCRAGLTWADNNRDCNDNNFNVNPGRTEIPTNGIDENCDNADDCYIDVDRDGYGRNQTAPSPFGLNCRDGYSSIGGDCLDLAPGGETVFPGAPEVPGNGIDENCDGNELCYIDQDQDLWGGPLTRQTSSLTCAGAGISDQTGDCNEADPTVNPGATERPADNRDQDCDGFEDCYRDADDDDFGVAVIVESTALDCDASFVAPNDDDCFDTPPDGATVYPGAPEIVGNRRDDDCDGNEACYLDGDGDKYGRNVFAFTDSLTCDKLGFAPLNTDCNDAVAAINPGANEIPADAADQNCDGLEACYQDLDGDRFGRTTTTNVADFSCLSLGLSPNDDDCNDVLPGGNFIYPGATEIPGNGVDEDCDLSETCYVDNDRDGVGGASTIEALAFDCVGPGLSRVGGDCNDNDATVYPGAAEIVADGKDQDCNGGDSCYQDIDADDYGSANVIPSVDLLCTGPNEAATPGDCLDNGTVNGVRARDINPGAQELCNEVDDDCDGLVDDDDDDVSITSLWFPDVDDDTFGDTTLVELACEAPGPGWTQTLGDCDDTNPAINPLADEVCDPENVDEDCNGKADNDDVDSQGRTVAQGAVTLRRDRDNDSYGSSLAADVVVTCDPGPGLVVNATDCLDTDALVNPGRSEVPYNQKDDDCNPGTPDDDLDGDGYIWNNGNTDCNDNPRTGNNVNPGASEGTQGNGVDDDCDGKVDEGTNWGDDDNDGYSEAAGDCNDANANIAPNKAETPNSLDDDCDGLIDEGTIRYDDDGDGETEIAGDCNDGDPDVNTKQSEPCPGTSPLCSDGIDNDCDGSVDGGTYDPDGDGYTVIGGDCDEGDSRVFPGAPELADNIDNDCDGQTDEGTDSFDDDGDGFNELQGDCNDNDEQVYPGAADILNGIDDDCDGRIDENQDNSDDDGDGFSELQGDCDDTNPQINPAAVEVQNGVDDDCDLETDEDSDDRDDDGYTTADGDCDDNDGWANPAQVEVCDQIDNDCDGDVDEGDADGTSICDDDAGEKPECTGGCCPTEGGGCSAGGPTGALGLALIPLLLVRRRQGKRVA